MWVAFARNVASAVVFGLIFYQLVSFLRKLKQIWSQTTGKCALKRRFLCLAMLFATLFFLCGVTHALSVVQLFGTRSKRVDDAISIISLLHSAIALAIVIVCFKVLPAILVELAPKHVSSCDANQLYASHFMNETVEAVRESIIVLSTDLTIVRENEASKALYVSPTLCGKSILGFIHPEDVRKFEIAAQKAIANYCVSPIIVQYRIKPADEALAAGSKRVSTQSFRSWKMSRVHNDEHTAESSSHSSHNSFSASSSRSIIVDVRNTQSASVWLESIIFKHMFMDNEGIMRTTLELVSRNIDDRKNKKHQNQLDSLLKETEEQQRINAAKLRYLSCIAHDLKTPLQSFCYTLDLLQQTELQAEQRSYIEQADVAVDLMKLTISQTMDISKALTGAKLMPRRTTVYLSSVLSRVEIIISGYSKQVPVSFEISPAVVNEIITDEEWLWQMLLNLLTNACKYTDKGSITVTVSLSKNPNPQASEKSYFPPFNLRTRTNLVVDDQSSATMLLFEVVDTGVGVADSKLPNMFDAFAQVQDGQVTGTGLGLFGVHMRAEGLQGSCGARHNTESPTGTGTIMWFAIPYVTADVSSRRSSNAEESLTASTSIPIVSSPAPATSVREAAATEVPSPNELVRVAQEILGSRPVTAMVVEDTLTVRKLMERMLLQMGFASVIGYENGSKGLDAMMAGTVDIVFSDVQMPVMTGPEMVSRFRKFEENALASGARSKRQMVVAVTANGTELDDMANIGFDGVYAKPLSRNDIYKIINQYL